jgi:hypothetical protein
MRLQKRWRRPKSFRQANRLPLALRQAGLCKRVQLGMTQRFAHADGEVGQHRDQALVVGAVVQGRQAQAVAGVQAVLGVHAPRHDVAGHQQFGHAQSAHATGGVVAGQYGAAKARLVQPYLHNQPDRRCYRSSGQGIGLACLRKSLGRVLCRKVSGGRKHSSGVTM